MKFLLKTYKRFLIGTLLLIIGLTLFVGTMIYLMPFNKTHLDYFPQLLYTLIFVLILVPSSVLLYVGFMAWVDESMVKDLFDNFKKAFSKDKE